MVEVIFGMLLSIASAFSAVMSAVAWCESESLYDIYVAFVWTGLTCYWLLRMMLALYPYVKYANASHSCGWRGKR